MKRKNNIYVEENTNRAFLLELLVSQIRLVATRSDPNRSIETCVQQHTPKMSLVSMIGDSYEKVRRRAVNKINFLRGKSEDYDRGDVLQSKSKSGFHNILIKDTGCSHQLLAFQMLKSEKLF